jgi:hypothetical protein
LLPARRRSTPRGRSLRAQAMDDAYGPSALDIVAPGETFETRITEGDAAQYGSVIVRAGATATLVERAGVSGSRLRPFLPSFSRIEVEPGATLHRIVVQTNDVGTGQADAAIVLNEAVVKLGQGATFRQFVLGEGAKLARIEISVDAVEGAQVELNGVYLASAKRHIDMTSRVAHRGPGIQSRQLVRGVARKGGRGVFQGKFLVERAGQKTDAEMAHNALSAGRGRGSLRQARTRNLCRRRRNAPTATRQASSTRQRSSTCASAACQRSRRARMITRAFVIEAVPEWVGRGPVRRDRAAHRYLAGDARHEHSMSTPSATEFPILGAQGARQAPGLFRQRRFGAEAERRDRRYGQRHAATATPTCIADCTRWRMKRRRHTKTRARLRAGSSTRHRVEEIVFTKGGTEAINIVAAGIGASIKPGDEIVLSIMEHHSNIVPWHFLRERKGAVLKWVDAAGRLARHGSPSRKR